MARLRRDWEEPGQTRTFDKSSGLALPRPRQASAAAMGGLFTLLIAFTHSLFGRASKNVNFARITHSTVFRSAERVARFEP